MLSFLGRSHVRLCTRYLLLLRYVLTSSSDLNWTCLSFILLAEWEGPGPRTSGTRRPITGHAPTLLLTVMRLSALPVELLEEIIVYALEDHPSPTDILCVDRTFLHLGLPCLLVRLRFRSLRQLVRFSECTSPLPCSPRRIEITFAGGSTTFEVFKHLESVLRRCLRAVRAGRNKRGHVGDAADITQVPLELLSFRLHSHTSNPYLCYIEDALSLVK